MRLFPSKRQRLIGIDISTTALKIVEVVRQRDTYHLESYAIQSLAQGTIVDDILVDSDAIGKAAAALAQRLTGSSRKAAIAMPAATTTTKLMDMPAHFTELQREAHIYVNAEQYIPYPLAEAYLDFEVVGTSTANPTDIQVLLVASKAEPIDHRVEALKLGGLRAVIVETVPYAIERAFRLIDNALPNAPSLIVLVDIGDEHTEFYIARDGTFVHSREQRFGGGQLTEAIEHKYGLSLTEAMEAKFDPSALSDYEAQVLNPFIDNLKQQLSRFIQLYLSSNPSSQVDHIVLCGGTACLSDLASILQNRLNIPTTVANLFQNMSIDCSIDLAQLAVDAPRLMTACGLALRVEH